MRMEKPTNTFTRTIFLLFLLSFELLFGLGNSATDSCSNNVDLSEHAGFSTTSLTCQSIWETQDFILRYGNESGTWSFLLSVPSQSSYVAIGFSKDGHMVGSSSIVGWVVKGLGHVKQYHLGGKIPSLVHPDDGNLRLVKKSAKAFTQSSRFYLAFQLSKLEPFKQLIYAVGFPDSIPEGPDYQLDQHLYMGGTSMKYATGNSPPPTDSPADAEADTCTNSVDFSKLAAFKTTSLKCQSVWASQSFILRYGNDANTWSFLLSAPEQSSYVAIGFSSNGLMVGSSAMVGWKDSGAGAIKQYSLGGKESNLVNPDDGNLPLVTNSTRVFTQSSRIYLAFQISTSQPSNRLIYAVGYSGDLPQSPNFRLKLHSYKESTSLDYASGEVQAQKTPYQKLRRAHGGINMFAWGIMMPIGAIVARYFKKYYESAWFYSHVAIQSTAFILGLTGVILGLVLEERADAIVTHHKGLGIAILVFACLQVTALMARPKKDAKYRKYWNWYHHYGGRILLILAVTNIFYGIDLANENSSWTVGYAIAFTLIGIAVIFLEVKKTREDKD